jgi:UDP-3-O-[3-hydroxymyristoyl] N-acetylglucosamine deacetylase/3-hydroxyacyl-[acyl-carrier-protein] dehydratase
MPGVLQLEAMAQAAGILMLNAQEINSRIAYFMSCDNVKFRRAVVPGDQLEIYVKLTKHRGNKIGVAEGKCSVGGKVASSGQLMFTLIESKE